MACFFCQEMGEKKDDGHLDQFRHLEGNNTEGLGIHGTGLPESIPGRTSNGCVRLLNENVEELYGFALIGTKVVIRE